MSHPQVKSLVKKNSRRKNCKHMPKESVDEFLDRGGKIDFIPLPSEQQQLVTAGPHFVRRKTMTIPPHSRKVPRYRGAL